MFKDKLKEIGKHEGNNKKKIENIVFLVIILILTIIFMNIILKDDTASSKDEEKHLDSLKVLAGSDEQSSTENSLERSLEKILSSIKGVGEVNVFINYSESSRTVAMYDERTTVSSTEENDSSGGVRNTSSTETQKDVIFSDNNGGKTPVTEKIVMPVIEGAIITAEGANNVVVKTNIIQAVEAVTGLATHKIQVFEMSK